MQNQLDEYRYELLELNRKIKIRDIEIRTEAAEKFLEILRQLADMGVDTADFVANLYEN